MTLKPDKFMVLVTVERLVLAASQAHAQDISNLTVGPLRDSLVSGSGGSGSLTSLIRRSGPLDFAAHPFAVVDEHNALVLFAARGELDGKLHLLYACLVRESGGDEKRAWRVLDLGERGTEIPRSSAEEIGLFPSVLGFEK